jgi:hypothetical protein
MPQRLVSVFLLSLPFISWFSRSSLGTDVLGYFVFFVLIAPDICGRNTQYTNSAAKLLLFYEKNVQFLPLYV